MEIEFKRLNEVDKSEIIDLMNNPLVRRQMPLTKDNFEENDCDDFISSKERLWAENGYGPWSLIVDGQFVGWGGLQTENGEADLALVLHPNYWGIGKKLYDKIIERAFGEMGFDTLTVLLPHTRTRIKGLLRLGFRKDGELEVGKEQFVRYRLEKTTRNKC